MPGAAKPQSMRSLVGGLGLATALLIGLLIPLGYAANHYGVEAKMLSFKARLTAERVAKYIYGREEHWQYHSVRLADLIQLPVNSDEPVRQRIRDDRNNVVVDTGERMQGPFLRRDAPIVVNGVTIGRLQAEMSLRPFLKTMGLAALASLGIGIAAYLAFRVLPLRALDRTLGALTAQNARFDTAINNMSQGLCLFDSEQRLVVCNEKYARIYGLPDELVKPGTPFQAILAHRLSHGMYAGTDPDSHALGLHSIIANSERSVRVHDMRDGRSIVVKHQPMADGGWVATQEDITEQRRVEAQIAHMAHHDALTDLPNRVLLRERLEAALKDVSDDGSVAVLCLDLDRFKEVNDTLGHPVGDALLKAVAGRLLGCVRETDTVARIGGDEFAVVQTLAWQPQGVTALAERIIEAITAPYEINGHQIVIGTSVGISVSPTDATDPGNLIKNADLALYRVKGDGRGTYRFFEPAMDALMHARRKLETDLRRALLDGHLELHYQPILDVQSKKITTFEALLRWNHPERGIVSPADFIPMAEETGLIGPIGEWVLRTACAQAATWPGDVRVAVNLSLLQFNWGDLVLSVFQSLATAGLAANRLELEITESVLLENTERTLTILHRLHELGARISLDDFGTGYSSLSNLRGFSFDKIKIDQSFVRALGRDNDALAIVEAVIGLGARLDMTTTAEGVETEDQLEWLRAMGITEVQGYFIARPMPASRVATLLSEKTLTPATAA
jgi:diguanylate cyclase (GGDEF)-like protein